MQPSNGDFRKVRRHLFTKNVLYPIRRRYINIRYRQMLTICDKHTCTLMHNYSCWFLTGPTDSHEPEIPKMRSVVEEEMTRIPSRPQLQLVVDDFYENVHPGCRAGKLRAYFDSYASYRTDGTVDETTMKLLKKHYDNSFGQQVSF